MFTRMTQQIFEKLSNGTLGNSVETNGRDCEFTGGECLALEYQIVFDECRLSEGPKFCQHASASVLIQRLPPEEPEDMSYGSHFGPSCHVSNGTTGTGFNETSQFKTFNTIKSHGRIYGLWLQNRLVPLIVVAMPNLKKSKQSNLSIGGDVDGGDGYNMGAIAVRCRGGGYLMVVAMDDHSTPLDDIAFVTSILTIWYESTRYGLWTTRRPIDKA